MLRIVVTAALVAMCLSVPSGADARSAPPAAPPSHTLEVSGTGVGMYPAYDPSVRRYAATTAQSSFPSNVSDPTANLGATVTVTATTSDPDGLVLVNGVPATSDEVTLTGVDAGDEISVVFVDSAGREADAVYVLPADFPRLTATIKEPGITPGLVGLTLVEFQDPTMPWFATFVDANGVPAWTRASVTGLLDLKRQPNGSFSVAEPTTTPGRTGYQITELDSRFAPVASHETVGLTDTDNHDSILQPDGSKVLIAYEVNDVTGRTDSVIQEIDPDGAVAFEWDSSALVGETVTPNQQATDYAHINSVEIVNGGQDYLGSFRGLSAVLLIARQAHDGFQPGDIVWKLGGRDSSFTFVDDSYHGPCAQHTASQLPNGDIMIFDDGSAAGLGDGPNCVNQSDPDGALLERFQSRVTVYHLDTVAHTATLVRSYEPTGWFSWFMGSAQYLAATGNIMVGWAADTRAVAEEVDADDTPVWRLVATPSAGNGLTYISYRALKFDVPDTTAPQVAVTVPAEGAAYDHGQRVLTEFTCTDTGGSTLQTCGSALPGRPLDTTTPGAHTMLVTATDGAGNLTTVRRHYTVGPVVHRPDLSVKDPDGSWLGTRVYGHLSAQTAGWRLRRGTPARIAFGITNRGSGPDRCTVEGSRGSAAVRATYLFDGRDVTRAVVAGTWRLPTTQPGDRRLLHLKVWTGGSASRGDARRFVVGCTAPAGGAADRAAARVVVR